MAELSGSKRYFKNVVLGEGGGRIEDPREVSNVFNKFFLQEPARLQASIANSKIKGSIPVRLVEGGMFLRPVVEADVRRIIHTKIRQASSPGPDEVPGFIIRIAAEYIVTALTDLINNSFCSGRFPSRLKAATVVPIHKKGTQANPANYRPVSMLSVFSKIYEYLMLERLLEFLDRGGIIDDRQHGFRSGGSTISAIGSFYESILGCIEGGGAPVGVFCDLSRAFDCVDHSLLLSKLYSYGVRGVPLGWIASYLGGRTQKVKIMHRSGDSYRSYFSDDGVPSMGVPQGGILAPLLFIIFTNDLPNHIGSPCVMYADDTSVLIPTDKREPVANRIESTVGNLSDWFSANRLLFNLDKTSILRFHTRQSLGLIPISMTVGGTDVKECDDVKFLGVVMDSTLSFNQHCEALARSLNSRCYQVRVLRTVLDTQQLRMFYFAQVHSRLSYGLRIWGGSAKMHDVFIVQKRILRTMVGVSNRHSCRQLFRGLDILPLPSMYIFQLILYVYESRERLSRRNELHTYNTRKGDEFSVPFRRLTLCMSDADTLGVRLYNRLPGELKRVASKNKFTRNVREYLTQMTCYSIQEFFQK